VLVASSRLLDPYCQTFWHPYFPQRLTAKSPCFAEQIHTLDPYLPFSPGYLPFPGEEGRNQSRGEIPCVIR
jgi:hypothetical protein